MWRVGVRDHWHRTGPMGWAGTLLLCLPHGIILQGKQQLAPFSPELPHPKARQEARRWTGAGTFC